MKKLLAIVVLGLLFSGNAYAKDYVIAEVNSYYSDQSKILRAKSRISIEDAKQKAIKFCVDNKYFNKGKPEGCLIWKIYGSVNGRKFKEKIWDQEVAKYEKSKKPKTVAKKPETLQLPESSVSD